MMESGQHQILEKAYIIYSNCKPKRLKKGLEKHLSQDEQEN